MRRYLFLLWCAAAVLVFVSADLQAQEQFYWYRGEKKLLEFSPYKISIKFKTGVTDDQIVSVIAAEPALGQIADVKRISNEKFYVLKSSQPDDVDNLVQRLRMQKQIESANRVFVDPISKTELILGTRFMVQFKPNVSSSEIESFNERNHVEVIRRDALVNLYVLKTTSASNRSAVAMAQYYYENMPAEYAKPDFLVQFHLNSTPNDTYFNYQYYLMNTSVPLAWDITKGDPNVVVAVLDDGGQIHPDLPASRVVQGWDYLDDDNNPFYDQLLLDGTESGRNAHHGIACAGIIAATQNNSTGISGAAPNCKIMFLRWMNENGDGYNSDAISAIDYAWQNGASVLSLSWGSGIYDVTIRDAVQRAITMGRGDGDLIAEPGIDKGCLVVAAAGNNGQVVEYPAGYDGVIAVGAIDRNNNIWDYSPPGVDVVAPSGNAAFPPENAYCDTPPIFGRHHIKHNLEGDVWTLDRPGNPGSNPGNYLICPPDMGGLNWAEWVWTTPQGEPVPQIDYMSVFSGTSAACPQVAALGALILSINPNLVCTSEYGPNTVPSIIYETADQLGEEYDDYFGWGRINAYQALLLALAYSTQSMDATATAHNSGRRLVRDGSDNYHLVFHSGGEIFYRKNVGGSWQTPQRLSSGDGNNKYPSLTSRDSKVFVTWQRKNGSTHDIWFHRSSDGGATWPPSNRTTLATSVGSSDPLAVITTPETNNVVVVYRKGNYLESKHLNDSGSVLATKSRTGVTLNSPTVANVNQQPTGSPTTALVYASGDNHIYYHYYTGSNWSSAWNLSIIVPGTNVSKTPSISCEGVISQPLHLAWHLSSGGGFGHIYYRKSTNHNTWPSQYTQLFYGDQYRPSITAFSSTSIDLLYQASVPQIYKQHFNGSAWSFPSFVGDGQYPSLSTGSTQAKYVWTNSGSAPFTINLSTEILSKENGDEPSYERAISWLDSLGSHLTLRVKNLSLKTSKGEIQTLALQPVSLDTVADFTPANAFDHLVSAPTLLPVDAESLVVDFTLWAENVEKIGSGNRPKISLEFRTSGDQLLHRISGPEFIARGSIAEKALRFAAPLAAVKQAANSTSIKAVLKIEGLSPEPEVFASLGHIYAFTKAISKDADPAMMESARAPKIAALFNNYPNPFNPETKIKYEIPHSAHVTLKIYNLLGQEVQTLVERIQDAGVHEIRWDGKDSLGRVLPSGLYLYRIEAGEYSQVRKMALLR